MMGILEFYALHVVTAKWRTVTSELIYVVGNSWHKTTHRYLAKRLEELPRILVHNLCPREILFVGTIFIHGRRTHNDDGTCCVLKVGMVSSLMA